MEDAVRITASGPYAPTPSRPNRRPMTVTPNEALVCTTMNIVVVACPARSGGTVR